MRKLRAALLTLACIATVQPADAACPTVQEHLTQYINSDAFEELLTRDGLDVRRQRIVFAALDHRTGDWKAITMSRARGEDGSDPFTAKDLTVSKVTSYSEGAPEILEK